MEEDKTTTEPQKEQDNDNEEKETEKISVETQKEKENQELAKITKQDKTSYIKLFERIKATECKLNKQCKSVKDLLDQPEVRKKIVPMDGFEKPMTQLKTEFASMDNTF